MMILLESFLMHLTCSSLDLCHRQVAAETHTTGVDGDCWLKLEMFVHVHPVSRYVLLQRVLRWQQHNSSGIFAELVYLKG